MNNELKRIAKGLEKLSNVRTSNLSNRIKDDLEKYGLKKEDIGEIINSIPNKKFFVDLIKKEIKANKFKKDVTGNVTEIKNSEAMIQSVDFRKQEIVLFYLGTFSGFSDDDIDFKFFNCIVFGRIPFHHSKVYTEYDFIAAVPHATEQDAKQALSKDITKWNNRRFYKVKI